MRTITQSITGRGLAVLIVGAGAAGCGSSSPTTTTTRSAQGPAAAAYAFSNCMREHGVSNFPDPHVTATPGGGSVRITAIAPKGQSPQFKVAQQACQHLLPGPQNTSPAQQHARAQALLAFARCLRSHGISNFPDPNTQGQLTIEMINAASVDLHAPGFLTAAKACVGVTHGAITGADVERAINGPH
ncbi:MAG TPA: hypothetical protein VG365_14750 [Solirubrobacteraceae bacterium]|nr:hypothetical protein [Solirubrobacteraceae bacterium]